jgi:putative flippase GtrA
MALLRRTFKLLEDQKFRYLISGVWNTLFGYVLSLILYSTLHSRVHIIIISVMANVIAITVAFIVYKFFVFKTKGNYLKEYFRMYITYGLSAIIGTLSIWFLVDKLSMEFWLSQILITIFLVIFTYIFNQKYTFKVN